MKTVSRGESRHSRRGDIIFAVAAGVLVVAAASLSVGSVVMLAIVAGLVLLGGLVLFGGLGAVLVLSLLALILTSRVGSTVAVGGIPLALLLIVIPGLLYSRFIRDALRGSAALRSLLFVQGLWLTLVAYRLLLDYPVYQQLALRDGVVTLCFLGVFVGAGLGRRYRADVLPKVLQLCAVVLSIFCLAYPFADRSVFVSRVTDFGNIGVAAGAVIGFALWSRRSSGVRVLALVSGSIGLVTSQGRMIYLVVILLIVMFVVTSRSSTETFRRLGTIGLVGAALVGGVAILAGLGVSGGRLGAIGLGSSVDQISGLFSSGASEAGSQGDRLRWWGALFASFDGARIVQGYGLGTDLLFGYLGPDGTLIRKPHNDYLEALFRTGVLSFVAIVLLVLVPLRSVARVGARIEGGGLLIGWYLGGAATAFAQPYFAYPHGALVLAVVGGLCMALDGDGGREEEPGS